MSYPLIRRFLVPALLLTAAAATPAQAGAAGSWEPGTVIRLPAVSIVEERAVVYSVDDVTKRPVRVSINRGPYPANWLISRARVTVSLEFVVNPRGGVEDVTVTAIQLLDRIDLAAIRDSADARRLNKGLPLTDTALRELFITDFREASLAAWKTARYTPGEKDGTPVYVRLTAEHTFSTLER